MNKFIAQLPKDFALPNDAVGRRLLNEYGALFVARGGAIVPRAVIFKNAAAVFAFQNSVLTTAEIIGDFSIELQAAAMKTLQAAIADAARENLTITPRGADAARRDYAGTVELWASRVNPGLDFHTGRGVLSETEAADIRARLPFEQVAEIFRLEADGLFFSKDLSKSIVYSVAPPGASQHLALLALDVCEHDDQAVRRVLARHFWFQTVVSDLPHFTFLGAPENRLPDLGLKKVSSGGRVYWLPDL